MITKEYPLKSRAKTSARSKKNALSNYRLGLDGFRKGYLNVAFTHLTAAVEANPDSADALYHIGLIHSILEDHNLAERYYKLTLGVNPNHTGAKKILDSGKNANIAKIPHTKITETDFFERLKEEGTPEAANIMEALEKMDFGFGHEDDSSISEKVIGFIITALKLLLPPLLAGFFVGMVISFMDFGPFLPTLLVTAIIVFLVYVFQYRIMEKFK